MSLKAKIEAVIYAAEEPVTLAQLAAVFATDLPRGVSPEADPPTDDDDITGDLREVRPSVESLIETGFVEVTNYRIPDSDQAEIALLTGIEEREKLQPAAEAEAKRAARQRDREVRKQLKAVVDSLIEEYAHSDRGMEISEVAGGYRIATKPEYHDAVRFFVKSLKPAMKLSLQALETLAVIAYKQPVTAPEISEIRGVDTGGVLGSLVSRKLITTAGRKHVIGRPILYKTTREFLLRFGLRDLAELPSIEEFEKLAGDLEIEVEDGAGQEAALPFYQATEPGIASTETNPGASNHGDSSETTEMGAPSSTTALSSAKVGETEATAEDPSETTKSGSNHTSAEDSADHPNQTEENHG
jgi:segregation and condensation protein B